MLKPCKVSLKTLRCAIISPDLYHGGLQLRFSILERGFALVRGSEGRLVRSVEQVHPGEDLQVRVSDGEFGVRVREADRNPR